MSVISLKTRQKYGTLLAGNPFYVPPSFESIATATGTGSSDTVTFSSIPSTYQHLQLRVIFNNTTTGGACLLRFNGDTGSNYNTHSLFGDGSSATATGSANTTFIRTFDSFTGTISTTIPAALIIDIHDYASTTKNKTARVFFGMDANSSTYPTQGVVALSSGAWRNTNAINSITLTGFGANFTTSSTFALYGIRG